MKPYYETHAVGALYLVVVLGWYSMELIQMLLQRQWRKRAQRIGPRSFWPAFWVGAAVAIAMLLRPRRSRRAPRWAYPP
jgi:cytochrome c biogenesis protein CcdA